MGYRVVDPRSVDPASDRPCECRKLSADAGLETMAINRFRAEPGEEIPLAYHYHETQQEAFYVVGGTLSVETPEETYTVEQDSLFVADPESPHRAYNPADADESVTVLAIGAPPVADDAHMYDPENEGHE
ncbi:cupin domain-containing protein [Natrialbaceae archaeon A-CW3]